MNLIKNPAYVPTDHTDGAVGEGNAPYICPISGIEMSGKFRFVFLWSCGCVLAERALKEVKQNLCHMVRLHQKLVEIIHKETYTKTENIPLFFMIKIPPISQGIEIVPFPYLKDVSVC